MKIFSSDNIVDKVLKLMKIDICYVKANKNNKN